MHVAKVPHKQDANYQQCHHVIHSHRSLVSRKQQCDTTQQAPAQLEVMSANISNRAYAAAMQGLAAKPMPTQGDTSTFDRLRSELLNARSADAQVQAIDGLVQEFGLQSPTASLLKHLAQQDNYAALDSVISEYSSAMEGAAGGAATGDADTAGKDSAGRDVAPVRVKPCFKLPAFAQPCSDLLVDLASSAAFGCLLRPK